MRCTMCTFLSTRVTVVITLCFLASIVRMSCSLRDSAKTRTALLALVCRRATRRELKCEFAYAARIWLANSLGGVLAPELAVPCCVISGCHNWCISLDELLAQMRRHHLALPWISRKPGGVCSTALSELARVARQNGIAVFYDWCAFGEVRRRGNRGTICCAAIGCRNVAGF